MKFKQIGNETINYDGKTITATNGIFEVDNKSLIQAMEANGYEAGEIVPETVDENQTILYGAPVTYEEAEDGRETEQADTEGQEIEAELSYTELKRKAKDAGIKGYQKMNKESLKKALEE